MTEQRPNEKTGSGHDELLERIKHYSLLIGAGWTSLVLALAFWDNIKIREETLSWAKIEARANYKKDVAFREWVTSHGGIYVLVDEKTPPNPYLFNIPERDITTPSGRKLTLMNPAYAARQLNEHAAVYCKIFGHITSQKLKNPINKPDEWEEKALKAFEKGETELTELTQLNGRPFLRLMRPIITKEGCLKCHGDQGYKVGDIRGGVSVSVSMEPYQAQGRENMIWHGALYAGVWVFGLIGLVGGSANMRGIAMKWIRARADIKESEERFHALSDAAYEGVAIHDKGVLITSNTAYAKMFGYEMSEIPGLPVINTVAPEFHDEIRRRMKEGYSEPFEATAIKKDGSRIIVKAFGHNIVYKGNPARISIISDITAQKQAENDLRTAKEKAEESNRLKSEFLSNMSHELNTPLTSVLGFSRIAQDKQKDISAAVAKIIELAGAPGTPPQFSRDIKALALSASGALMETSKCEEVVIEQGQKLFALLNDLMDLSMLESGQIKIEERIVSTFMLLASIEKDQKDQAAVKGLAFFVNSGDFIPNDLLFLGDAKKMEKVLSNLVQNAVKYSDRGSVRLTALQEGRNIVFRIRDDGMGIPPEDRDKIFETFRQLDGSAKRRHGGLGLGLSLAKRLVNAMGGEISFESEVGKGAEFKVTIPYRY